MKKIFLSALFTSLIAINASSMTLRLHMPINASGSDCTFNNTVYSCEPKSSGFGLRAIFGVFGVGYVSSEIDYGFPTTSGLSKFKLRSDAVDLSGTFFDGLLTAGVGTIIGGYQDVMYETQSGGNAVTMEMTGGKHAGTTSFLNLAIDVGPVELIGGYRIWDTEVSETSQITKIPAIGLSQASTNTEKNKNKYNELTIGVGIKF